jgi:GxxExxY protein
MKPFEARHLSLAETNIITGQIVDAALRVHRELGPGLLESAYETCLAYELKKRGYQVRTQVGLPISYEEVHIDAGYRIDLVVEEAVIVEVKAVMTMSPLFEAQLLSYLHFSGAKVGLLINFCVPLLKDGIKRMANPNLPVPETI